MLTHDGRRTSEDARRRTKIDTCSLFILVCNYFQWNQISFYNYYSWRWRYINIYRSHDRIIYVFNMWKNSRSLTLETNYRDIYFSEYWVVLHHVIRQYFKWKYKSKKTISNLSSSTKCEIIIPTLSCPYVSLFIILNAKFKNKFDLFYKITDDLIYSPKFHYLIALMICHKERKRHFFYKVICQRFCDEKHTDNILNQKKKPGKSPSDRVTGKTLK